MIGLLWEHEELGSESAVGIVVGEIYTRSGSVAEKSDDVVWRSTFPGPRVLIPEADIPMTCALFILQYTRFPFIEARGEPRKDGMRGPTVDYEMETTQ